MGSSLKKKPASVKSKSKFTSFFIVVFCIAFVLVNVIFFSPTALCPKATSPDADADAVSTAADAGKSVVTASTTTTATATASITANNSNNRFSKLISKLNEEPCTDEEITVRCICGADTQPQYISRMVETYAASKYDTTLFETCIHQKLPFDGNTPLECWPTIMILPSYPTSGNELARSILTQSTKRNMHVSEYDEPVVPNGRTSNLYVLMAAGNALRIYTNICDHKDENKRVLPFGMMGKSTLYKTHGPKGVKWGSKQLSLPLTHNPHLGGFTTGGIVHLTRNPGDQLLRQAFRWNREGGMGCGELKCFIENKYAQRYCTRAMETVDDWVAWHNFWIGKSSAVPRIFYHYEHFSNSTLVTSATAKVMDFFNEVPPPPPTTEEGEYSPLGNELNGVIRDPEYVHGTLMARVCGEEKARELHKATKVVSEQLGYVFDDESATWSMVDRVGEE